MELEKQRALEIAQYVADLLERCAGDLMLCLTVPSLDDFKGCETVWVLQIPAAGRVRVCASVNHTIPEYEWYALRQDVWTQKFWLQRKRAGRRLCQR